MIINKSVTINRPVEEVFAYMSNAENDRHWRVNVKSIERVGSGTSSEVGTEYKQKVKGPFGGLTADLRYTEYVPNERVAFETIRGAVRPSATIEFASRSETETKVTFTMTWEPTGPIVLLRPLIGPILRKTANASYDNLVRHMEAGEDRESSTG